jgi:hypothetical protein
MHRRDPAAEKTTVGPAAVEPAPKTGANLVRNEQARNMWLHEPGSFRNSQLAAAVTAAPGDVLAIGPAGPSDVPADVEDRGQEESRGSRQKGGKPVLTATSAGGQTAAPATRKPPKSTVPRRIKKKQQ